MRDLGKSFHLSKKNWNEIESWKRRNYLAEVVREPVTTSMIENGRAAAPVTFHTSFLFLNKIRGKINSTLRARIGAVRARSRVLFRQFPFIVCCPSLTQLQKWRMQSFRRSASTRTEIEVAGKAKFAGVCTSNSNLFRVTWVEHRSHTGQAELTTAHIMRVVNSVVPTLPNRRNRASPSCAARN